MISIGQDTSSLDDEAFNMEASLDRCILKLIASCCNGEFVQLKWYTYDVFVNWIGSLS